MPELDYSRLRRSPDVEAPNLQAWDATDQLLVQRGLDTGIAGGETAIIGDEYGAIALALGVDQEWLEHGGPLNAESPRPGGPDGGDGLADVTSLEAPNSKKPSWFISQVATLAAAA